MPHFSIDLGLLRWGNKTCKTSFAETIAQGVFKVGTVKRVVFCGSIQETREWTYEACEVFYEGLLDQICAACPVDRTFRWIMLPHRWRSLSIVSEEEVNSSLNLYPKRDVSTPTADGET